MAEHIVGRVYEIPEGQSRVYKLGSRTVGVFHIGGSFYALNNNCPHQGGPLCTGEVLPALRAVPEPGRLREYFDRDQMVVCCPWHGWEFDIKTGRCLADSDRAVATYPVKVVEDQIVVVL